MNFNITKDSIIKDILLIQHDIFEDHRGILYETFHKNIIKSYIDIEFIQEKCIVSNYGVLRGLHFQKDPYGQGKLVRCTVGKIYDVAVDIRPNSITYGQWVGHELSDVNHKMIYIPPGFAHGVLSLSKNKSIVHYFTTHDHEKNAEAGIIWSDQSLNIQWPIPISDIVLSEKDKGLPTLAKI